MTARQASLSITNSWSLPKLMPIKLVMPSSHLILCHPLLLPPSILPSIRVFSNESTLHIRWPKYGSFSFSISPSNEHPGLISFRMDWLDLLAVQGTLLQHHRSKRVGQIESVALTHIHCCCSLVTKSHLTLCDTMDYSSLDSSVLGISRARISEWVAISFSNIYITTCKTDS